MKLRYFSRRGNKAKYLKTLRVRRNIKLYSLLYQMTSVDLYNDDGDRRFLVVNDK